MSGKESIKSLSIFDYIREINKLSADILSPAKFKILVEIAMRLGENGKTWPKNKELSINTAIKPSSIKVLMSQLKKDSFINIEKEDRQRMIYLCHPTERKRLMVINQNGKRLMVINQKVNGDLPFVAIPIKRKEKKILKEKMLPQGISFENYFKNLPSGIHRKIRKADVKYYWDRGFKDDLIRAASGLDKMPENDQILIFQGIINAFKRKLPMKYEELEKQNSDGYKFDLIPASKNLNGLNNGIGNII